METTHNIIFGDSRQLNKIDDKSVHLIVTSPPYWQLKDYGTSDQIGFNDSYEEYINNLNIVWGECHRVLMDGCRLCINIGDQFARSVYYGRYKVIPIRDEIVHYCETIGFDYMGAIIWQKVTTCNTTGGATIMGSFPFPRNGIVKLDYEYILLFKKQGNPPKISADAKNHSKMSIEEWNQYFSGHWYFPGAKQDKHIAMFPEELPSRLIRMFSFEGETVFDPFLGSGTTSLAALKLGRNSIGYEINSEYKELLLEKIYSGFSLDCHGNLSLDTDTATLDYTSLESKLAYRYKDPVKINKLINPNKLSFGSVISANEANKQQGNTLIVKKIIEPDIIQLNTNLNVKLMGVLPKSGSENEAIEYLKSKIIGKRVILKFDDQKYFNDLLLAYIYLENKTFINKHYLLTGLVDVDRRYQHKLMSTERKI